MIEVMNKKLFVLTLKFLRWKFAMAPKVCVPMDFGRHLLGSPTHNNLKLNSNEGGEVLASSVILSFNSPVIDHMTTTLHMTSVDLLEFSEAGVQLFVDCAYSGTAEGITRGLFRDVNKIANVFEVAWLIGECSKYFNKIAESIESGNYPEPLFIFEEAAFIYEHLKKKDFMEVAFKQIEKFKWKRQFIDNYLNNADRLSTKKLDLVIELAGSEVEFVVQKLTQQLTELVLERGLPNYCRYLLDNSDLSLCKNSNGVLLDNLFTVLDNLPDNELRWTYALLRKSTINETKELSSNKVTEINTAKSSMLDLSRNISSTSSDNDTSLSQPNLIESFKPVFKPKLRCLDDLFKWLHESEDVNNIMMALEAVSKWNIHCVAVYNTETSVNVDSMKEYDFKHPLKLRLENLRRSRGWLRLPSTLLGYRIRIFGVSDLDISFLCCLADAGIGFDSLMLCCSHETLVKRNKRPDEIFIYKYAFYFQHPSVNSCNQPGLCGFFLQTDRSKSLSSLDLTLCTKSYNYHHKDSLHYHPEVQAEDFIHMFHIHRESKINYIEPWSQIHDFTCTEIWERRPAVLYRVKNRFGQNRSQ